MDLCTNVGLIGNFVNGLPNKKLLYYNEASDHEKSTYALTTWDMGKLISFKKNYKDKKIDIEDEIQESRFWLGWNIEYYRHYRKEEWWEAYKNEFL